MKMNIDIKENTTHQAVEKFESYKDEFGRIIKAVMVSNPVRANYHLRVYNSNEDTINFYGGLTAGYTGTGPRGTIKVLKMGLLEFDENIVLENSEFIIEN